MNKEQLFEAMDGIEDTLLERSEKDSGKTKIIMKWSALAACLGLVIAACVLLPRQTPRSPDNTLQQDTPVRECHDRNWTAQYNEGERTEMDFARVMSAGYFYEELTQEQINQILPPKSSGWKDCTGRGYFRSDGTVDKVVLDLATESGKVQVTWGNYFSCVIYSVENTVTSWCGDVEYTLYCHDSKHHTLLEADAKINGVPLHFAMETTALQQGMLDFEAVLECFSWYAPDSPDLSRIEPSHIPEFVDKELDGLAQAYSVPEFGSLMPQKVPGGFTEESIRRYKDYNSDYLSGLWTRGYDELSWRVSVFTDADAQRVTSVAETKNYDLSLYPIPRVESVPEELRQIVDDPVFLAEELTLEAVQARAYKVNDAGEGGSSWRMEFSVKYGDMLVRVRTKGVDPQWLYTQLIQLRDENH